MPFQSGNITIELPGDTDVLKMAGGNALKDCSEQIKKALAEPIGTPPFAEIVREKVEAKKSKSGTVSAASSSSSVPNDNAASSSSSVPDSNSSGSRTTSVPHDNNTSVPHDNNTSVPNDNDNTSPKNDASPNAVIVISDNTRPVPYTGEQGILWPLVRILIDEGVRGEDITVLVATGTHRALTDDEINRMIDPRVLEAGVKLINHDCKDQNHLQFLGTTKRGTNIYIDDRYLKADIKILTGLVESHFMAGASGGRKAICPGLIGEASTFIFHGAEMLGHPKSDDLVLDGNPCHEEAVEVAKNAGADFIVNVTLDGNLDVTGVFAGELEKAHEAAVEQVKAHVGIPVKKEYDVVVAHAGFVGINHYQVAKVGVEAMKVVKPDGFVIVAADNTDGSHAVGALTYRTTLQLLKVIGPENFMKAIQADGWTFIPEQWQTQMWTKLFDKIPMDHFYYYSPQFTREHYLMSPGVDGSQLLDSGVDTNIDADGDVDGDGGTDSRQDGKDGDGGTGGSSLDRIPEFVEKALQDAAKRLGKSIDELDVCYLQDGPYGIPLKE